MRFKAIALAVCVFLSAAQSRPAIQDSGASKFSVAVNLVKVPISVFDSAGFLMPDLRTTDFRVWEDQAPQEIRSFGLDTNSVSVVMVLDTSRSSEEEQKQIKQAAEAFAGALSTEDRFSLITFDDEVYRNLDWTGDVKKLRKALGKVQPGLRTALYDAMYLAATDQLKAVEGRKAVILLTDCVDNQSSVDFKEAALAIVQSQASLYVVSKTAMLREEAKTERNVVILTDIYRRLFGSDDNYVDEFFKKREAEMTDLAEKTGGRCFFPAGYNRIKGIYEEVAKELKSKFFLTYVSNQRLDPDSYHRISIEYLGPASKVLYRKGYYYLPKTVQRVIRQGAVR